MQLFLVQPRVGKTRVINLRNGLVLSTLLLFPLFSCIFYLGARYGSQQIQQEVQFEPVFETPTYSEMNLENPPENKIDALAMRLGQLQSQMLRLNVIGQRVIEELHIAQDEFDLFQVPAMGGVSHDELEKSQSFSDLLDQVDTLSIHLHEKELQLQTFSDLLTDRELKMETFPAGRPIKNGAITSTFGWRVDPFSGRRSFHSGVDFAARRGAKVYAVASGLVIWAERDGGYGNLVSIDHGDGYVTRYAHNRDILVKVGDRVDKGDAIAHMGSTGHSTGPHVHFEVLQDGIKINPWKFVRTAG